MICHCILRRFVRRQLPEQRRSFSTYVPIAISCNSRRVYIFQTSLKFGQVSAPSKSGRLGNVRKYWQVIPTQRRAQGKMHLGSKGRNTSKVEAGVKWDERKTTQGKWGGKLSGPNREYGGGGTRRTVMGNRTAVTALGRMEFGVPYTAVT